MHLFAAIALVSYGTSSRGQLYFLPDRQDVTSVAWSPDGTHILSSGFDGTIRLWKADRCESGPLIYIDDPRAWEGEESFRSTRAGVMSVAWSSDGKHFVAGLRDRTVRLYEVTWNAPHPWRELFDEIAVFSVEGQLGLRTVAFSRDGQIIASAGHDSVVRLWEAKKHGSLIRELRGHTDAIQAVNFSDASTIISGGSDGTILTWDVESGAIKSTFTAPGPVTALALSRDGQLVAAAVTKDRPSDVFVWRMKDWRDVRHIDLVHRVFSLAFNHDGSQIAGAAWGETDGGTVWNMETGKPIFKFLSTSLAGIRGLAYSPDGKYLVAGTQMGTAILLDANTGEIVREFGKCSSTK